MCTLCRYAMAHACMHHIVCTWRTSARTMFVIEDDLMPTLDEQTVHSRRPWPRHHIATAQPLFRPLGPKGQPWAVVVGGRSERLGGMHPSVWRALTTCCLARQP